MKKVFKFSAKVWLWPGDAPWHFVTLPKKLSEEIDFYFGHIKGGWGSIRDSVTLGKTLWKTSIFPDKKIGSYILPLKIEVRKKESLREGDDIKLSLEIRDNL